MDFFEHQRRARRQSRRLVWLFLAAVLVVVLVIDLVVLLAFGLAGEGQREAGIGWIDLAVANWPLLAVASAVTGAVIGLSSLGRIGGLRAGGAAVARQLGGTEVPADTTDPSLRRLRNVVEEIAIASSLPVPDVFVLEGESGINAFAAGWAPGDAAVAVTRGALDRLNRDELQGVVAHEFSHVLNGDMRLNIRLMGLLFGLLVLGIVGRKTLRVMGRGRRSKDSGPIILIALAVMVMGYVGLFLGRLIKAGVSRSREYLADASAVQFTRQSAGIAGALKKIGGLGEGSRIAHADGEEVSHMLFGSGQGLRGWWATHPPLERRIAALDPSFRPEDLARQRAQWLASPPSGMAEDLALGLAAEGEVALPAGASEVRVSAEGMRRHVGNPDQADFGRAGTVLHSIPAPLRQAARDRSRAMALVAALLQDPDAVLAARQRALWLPLLARQGMVDVEGGFEALAAACRELHPLQRLPLAELAFPQLRRRPRPELEAFMDAVEQAIHVDGQVELFEYALGRMLKRQVLEALDPASHWKPGRRRLAHSRQAVVDVLRVLAAHAGGSEEQSARAFAAGLHRVLGAHPARYAPANDAIALLDLALPQLDALEPLAKAVLVEGLVEAASHDGRLSLGEAELVRAICATLQCPMPPVLEDLPLAA